MLYRIKFYVCKKTSWGNSKYSYISLFLNGCFPAINNIRLYLDTIQITLNLASQYMMHLSASEHIYVFYPDLQSDQDTIKLHNMKTKATLLSKLGSKTSKWSSDFKCNFWEWYCLLISLFSSAVTIHNLDIYRQLFWLKNTVFFW